MKKIETDKLVPGTKFSAPLFIDEDNVILQPGVELKQKEIDLLRKWNIQIVYTDGEMVISRENKLKNTVYQYHDFINIEAKTLDFYSSLIEQLDGIFNDIQQEREIQHKRVDEIVKPILEEIDRDQNSLIHLILLGNKDINKLTVNSLNSTILSGIVGKNMKMVNYRLIQVAIGALFHDLGLLKISKEILEKKEKLNPEEREQINRHPVLSYNIISKILKYPEEIAQIALFHMERWDGTGYPNKLKGDNIPIGARIVAVAEAYEAMVNKRAYRDEMLSYRAMKQLLSGNGRFYDPGVLRIFLSCIGIYPIGSLVRLNDNSIARVLIINNKVPLRPKVEMIIDKYGIKLQETSLIDLNTQKNVFIVEPFDHNALGEAGK